MKKLLCMLLMLVMIAPAVGAEVEQVDMGYRMLKPLHDAQGQFVCSPESLRLALGMAARGAAGETKAQLDALVGDVGALDDPEVRSANAFVLAPDVRLNADYQAALSDEFDAEPMPLDDQVVDKLNAWAAEKTGGMIPQLLTERPAPDVKLMLVNALTLDAKWERPFFDTRDRTFHGASGDAEVPFMLDDGAFLAYAEADGVQAVKLPYEGGTLEMIVALPEAGGLGALLSKLGEQGIAALGAFSEGSKLDLSMPKFSLSSELDMKPLIQGLGVTDAFGLAADFSAMTNSAELFISDVLQNARIDVDEQGTRAAAVTMAVASAKGLSFDLIEMTVDRPFLALVRAVDSGKLLFAAVVEDL